MPQAGRPSGLVVIQPVRDWVCAECGGTGDLLRMDDAGPLCLSCADLDHLVFLPSGDAAQAPSYRTARINVSRTDAGDGKPGLRSHDREDGLERVLLAAVGPPDGHDAWPYPVAREYSLATGPLGAQAPGEDDAALRSGLGARSRR